MAHGDLRRLLLHELHGLDDRLRRAALPVQRRAAAVGDRLDLPDGDRVGVRHRLAARAVAGPSVPAGAGAAALHAQGVPAARAVPAASSGYGRTGELLGAVRSTRSGGGSWCSTPTRTASTRSSSAAYHADVPGLVADARDPGHLGVAGIGQPALRGGARADQRRRGEPGGHHDGGPAAPRPAGDRADRVTGDRRADARLRHPDRRQSVRPVRRPPADRAARPGHLPADDVAGERPGRRRCRPAAARPPTGRWVVCGYGRFGRRAHRGPARRGTRGRPSSTRPPTLPRTRASIDRATGSSRRCWSRPGWRTRSGSSPARTTTPPTCR